MAIRFDIDADRFLELPALEKKIYSEYIHNKEFDSIDEALNQEFQGRKIGGFWGFKRSDEKEDRRIYVGAHIGKGWREIPALRYVGTESMKD